MPILRLGDTPIDSTHVEAIECAPGASNAVVKYSCSTRDHPSSQVVSLLPSNSRTWRNPATRNLHFVPPNPAPAEPQLPKGSIYVGSFQGNDSCIFGTISVAISCATDRPDTRYRLVLIPEDATA